MAPTQDMEVEGVTTFTSSPSTSYRYVIQLKNGKMSIWMEDRVSKKQWYKGAMVKADYVTSGHHYGRICDRLDQDALDCQLEGDDDVQRELEAVNGGGMRLTLAVTIRVLRSTRMAKFTFDLDPVSVERIDILESKLRDQQDELERFRGDFDAGQVLPSIQLSASTKNGSTSNLCWKTVEADDFTVDEEENVVKIHRCGLYKIATVVNCVPSSGYGGQTVSLMKNGECIQLAYCPYESGNYSSATLNTIARLEQDDYLAVHCTCTF